MGIGPAYCKSHDFPDNPTLFMLALIDYGSGNIRSVQKALQHVGAADVQLVSNPADLAHAQAVVLPGVGAFGDCVHNLQVRGLWEPLKQWLAADKPFLGICVGYQLLFESSEEAPGIEGLGFFKGTVRLFQTPGLKVPQMGWNSLQLAQPGHLLWRSLPASPSVYFVHSYYPVPADASTVTATAEYGTRFAAASAIGRVAAVQFHPEKSQQTGLAMLGNFIASL